MFSVTLWLTSSLPDRHFITLKGNSHAKESVRPADGLFAATCVCWSSAAAAWSIRDEDPLPNPRKGGGGFVRIQFEKLTPVRGDYKAQFRGFCQVVRTRPESRGRDAKLREAMNKNNDSAHCLKGTESGDDPAGYRIGKNGNLGNVFVWIAPEAKQAFEVPDDQMPKPRKCCCRSRTVLFAALRDGVRVALQGWSAGSGRLSGAGHPERRDRDAQRRPERWAAQRGAAEQDNPALERRRRATEGALRAAGGEDVVTVPLCVHGWMTAYVRVFDHTVCRHQRIGADMSNPKKPIWENLTRSGRTFEIKGCADPGQRCGSSPGTRNWGFSWVRAQGDHHRRRPEEERADNPCEQVRGSRKWRARLLPSRIAAKTGSAGRLAIHDFPSRPRNTGSAGASPSMIPFPDCV